jgi:hypothetical protein
MKKIIVSFIMIFILISCKGSKSPEPIITEIPAKHLENYGFDDSRMDITFYGFGGDQKSVLIMLRMSCVTFHQRHLPHYMGVRVGQKILPSM